MNRVGFCRKQISVVVIVCVSEISAFSGQFAHSYTTKLTWTYLDLDLDLESACFSSEKFVQQKTKTFRPSFHFKSARMN